MNLSTLGRQLSAAIVLLFPGLGFAAGALDDVGGEQALNPTAIGMFLLFVAFTLYVTCLLYTSDAADE